ncbi:MAG: adenylosuccinate synthetase [Nanoarchaeota archaeon]|nr:adenylosuccinate synthetase [Nanoarchaeota archaeon]
MISQLETKIFEGLKNLPRIPELDFEPTVRFIVGTEKEILYPLIEENDAIGVGGAVFGDEGKGKTVDAIAYHPKIKAVMRDNSGENAGHTVFKIEKYIFHLMPSGILIPGKVNLIGPECVMDPVSFMEKEVGQLVKNGISYDNLYVGNVHIVTPYHKLMDLLGKPPNSSTLKGMSDVHASKVMKRGLRLDDLFGSMDRQVKLIRKDMETYLAFLKFQYFRTSDVMERCEKENEDGNKRIPDHVIEFVEADDKVEYLLDLYERYVSKNENFPKRADTRRMLREVLKSGGKVLLEGSQSNPLSNASEIHFRSSTSADTSADGVIASARYNPRKYNTVVINIHKLPPSRVGRGANPMGFVSQTYFSDQGIDSLEKLAGRCEDVVDIEKLYFNSVKENGVLEPRVYHDFGGKQYLVGQALAIAWSKKFKECGATTKKPRVLGLFDCVLQNLVNEEQGPYLSISAVDRFDECKKVGVVIAYVYHHPEGEEIDSKGTVYKNGDIIKPGSEIPNEDVLYHCHPIVKVMDGWKGSPIAADKRKADDPLPENLQKMLGVIEHFTESEIISIGNGEKGKDLIYLKRDLDGGNKKCQ